MRLVLMFGMCAALIAQDLAFEVATIKDSGPRPSREVLAAMPQQQRGPLYFDWIMSPAAGLIMLAYDLDNTRVIVPQEHRWMWDDQFDVHAKAPRESTYNAGLGMLRTLLTERFGLRFHWEKRELPAYILTIAKGGLKMREAPPRPGTPTLTRPTRSADQVTVGTGRGADMESIAFMIGRSLLGIDTRRILIDRTGLTGTYDLDIEYLDPGAEARTQGRPLGDAPNIFRAVEESLGLHIDAVEAPVDVLVIDSAQRPGEN